MQMQFMLCQISLRDWSLQRLQHVKEQIKFFQQRGSTEKRFREKRTTRQIGCNTIQKMAKVYVIKLKIDLSPLHIYE